MKTCFFIGHHTAPDKLQPFLDQAIERHILEYGVMQFTVGRYGNFDRLVARSLKIAKEQHPDIIVSLLTPYHPFDYPIDAPPGFDNTFYPPGMETVPRRAAIIRANQYMIANSDYLIAYARGYAGNTGRLMDDARRRSRQGRIHIENLASGI